MRYFVTQYYATNHPQIFSFGDNSDTVPAGALGTGHSMMSQAISLRDQRPFDSHLRVADAASAAAAGGRMR